MRQNHVRGLTLLALAALAACTADTRPAPKPDGVRVTFADALRPAGSSTFRIQAPVTATERLSDGNTVVVNTSGEPVRLISVEPIAAGAGPVVLGTHVVPLADDDQNVIGLEREYPRPGTTPTPVDGAVLEPGRRYQLVLGLQVPRGTVELTGLRVTYEAAGRAYTSTFDHAVTLCTGRPATATSCER